MGRRQRLHKAIQKKDMRYRGPLSYISFKLLGWVCLSCAVLATLLQAAGSLNAEVSGRLKVVTEIADTMKDLSLPFFLIGNFAIIIDNKKGYKRQLITTGAGLMLVTGVFLLLVYRYIAGVLILLVGDTELGAQEASGLLTALGPYGFYELNIFVDLFLCTLFMYFLNCAPTKHFQGKKIVLFRLCALLPILYEVTSLTLKALSALGKIQLPAFLFPLLTVKPPMTFVLFIILAFFIKRRERHFRSLGFTREDYRAFLKTNRNSWHFSVYTALILFAAGFIDAFAYVILTDPDFPSLAKAGQVALALGVGDAGPMLMLSPVMLLFSYTRRNKYPMLETFIPAIGMTLIAVTVLEGSYQLLKLLGASMLLQ